MKVIQIKKMMFHLLLSSALLLTLAVGYKTQAAESVDMEGTTSFGVGFTTIKNTNNPPIKDLSPITRGNDGITGTARGPGYVSQRKYLPATGEQHQEFFKKLGLFILFMFLVCLILSRGKKEDEHEAI